MVNLVKNYRNLSVGEKISVTEKTVFGDLDVVCTRTSEKECEIALIQNNILLQISEYNYPELTQGSIVNRTHLGKDLSVEQMKDHVDIFEIVKKYNHLVDYFKQYGHRGQDEFLKPINSLIKNNFIKGIIPIKLNEDDDLEFAGYDTTILFKGKLSKNEINSWISEIFSKEDTEKCWRELEEFYFNFSFEKLELYIYNCPILNKLYSKLKNSSYGNETNRWPYLMHILDELSVFYDISHKPVNQIKIAGLKNISKKSSKIILSRDNFWLHGDSSVWEPTVITDNLVHILGNVVFEGISRGNEKTLLDSAMQLLEFKFPNGTKLSNSIFSMTVMDDTVEFEMFF